MRIAGVVVLYNPDQSVMDNMKSYLDSIEVLYVVDNTDTKKNEKIINAIQSLDKIVYIDNNGNKGIANALNVGASLAIKEGYDWLLTMDQDSRFINRDSIDKMSRAVSIYNKIVIITLFQAIKFAKLPGNKSEFSIVPTTMMSGNLLNLKVYQEVGGFREDYFIDFVDMEFSIRARLLGFVIVRCNSAILEHNLGDIKKHKLGLTTNHSPIRKYYITRNRLYTMYSYKNFDYTFFASQRYGNFVDIIRIILYERQKIKKLLMIYRGYKDFKKGIMGKYER